MALKLKLKLARIEKRQVQWDVAKVLNVTEQTYNRKELGISNFTLKGNGSKKICLKSLHKSYRKWLPH